MGTLSGTLDIEIFANKKLIRALNLAMTPETRSNHKRCNIRLKKKRDDVFGIELSSSNLAGLRAGLNTNLRLIAAAVKTVNSVPVASSHDLSVHSQKITIIQSEWDF